MRVRLFASFLIFLFSAGTNAQPVDDALGKLKDLSYDVRVMALAELSRLRDPKTVPDIEEAIEVEAKYPRAYLQSLKPPGPGACGNDEYYMAHKRAGEEVIKFRSLAARALIIPGPAALAARMRGLSNKDGSIRMEHIRAQKEAKDPEAFSMLLKEAEEKSTLQATAYDALVAYHDRQATPLHLKTLRLFGHAQGYVLDLAVKELAFLKVKEAIPILIGHSRIKYYQLRIKALGYLRQFDSKEAIDAIVSRLDDKDKRVRFVAMTCLERYNDTTILPRVMRALRKSSEPDIQIRALLVLRKIGSKETIKQLEPFLKSSHKAVRKNAEWAIRDLTAKP